MQSPAVLVTLAVLGYAAWYALMCSQFPFRNCRTCKGDGRRHNKWLGGGYRLCSRCGGTGRRVRLGRRITEYLRTEHARGQIPGDPRETRRPR